MQLTDKTLRRLSTDCASNLVALVRTQSVCELIQRAPDELGLLPEVGGKESVGVGDGGEGSLEGVLEGLGGTGGGGVGVLNTSKLQETLDGGGGDKGGTTGGGDELMKHVSTIHVSEIESLHALGENEAFLRFLLTRTVTEPHLPDSLTGREWG